MQLPFARRAPALALGALLFTSPAGAQDAYEQALSEFADGRFAEAVISLRNVLQQNPDNPSARVLLGRALLGDGEIAAAETALRRALAEGADNDVVIVPLGRALLFQREFKALFEQVRRGGRADSLEADVALVLGEAHLLLNDLDEADTQFFDAARLAPDDPAPVLGRALVALRGRLPDAARDRIAEAEALDANNPDTVFTRGELARFERRYEAAIEAFDETLELVPGHVSALLGRADAEFNTGRYDAALASAEQVLEQLPEDLEGLYLAAMSTTRLGDDAAALGLFQRAERALARVPTEALREYLPGLLLGGAVALALDDTPTAVERLSTYVLRNPRHVEAAKLLGAAQLRLGDARAALDALVPVVQYAAQDPGLKVLLARARIEADEPGEAARLLDEAAALLVGSGGLPGDIAIAFDRAVARLATGDTVGAFSDLGIAATVGGSLPAGLLLVQMKVREGQFEGALDTAQVLNRRNPRSPLAANALGVALRSAERPDEAREAFARAIALDGNYVEPRLNVARLEVASGDFDAGERTYREILELQPQSVETMSDLARLLRARERPDEALALFRQLIAIAPDRVSDRVAMLKLVIEADRLGDAARLVGVMEGDFPQDVRVKEAAAYVAYLQNADRTARAKLATAARLAGFDADWLLRLAIDQLAIGDVEGARWSLDKAVNSRPGFLPAERLLAQIEVAEGDQAAALARAARLAELAPDASASSIVLGDVLFAEGKHAEAASAYRSASEQQQTAELLMRESESLLESGDTDAAVELLQDWLLRLPRSHEVRLALASTLSQAGKLEEAIAEYERLAAELPKNAFLKNNLAWLYRRTGRDGSLEMAQEAYELAPTEPAVIDTLGWTLHLKGRHDEALALLRDANVRDAGDPQIQYHLGAVLAARGSRREAISMLRRALSAPPPIPGEPPFEGHAAARELMASLEREARTAVSPVQPAPRDQVDAGQPSAPPEGERPEGERTQP